MLLRLWAARNVPLIAHVRPRVLVASDDEAQIVIPLRRRTRNHLGSMYFGALQIGADLAGGYLALRHARGQRMSFVFKDAHASFLRRPEQDVRFTCQDGASVKAVVQKALTTGERHEVPVVVVARCGDEVVARFTLTLSLKAK